MSKTPNPNPQEQLTSSPAPTVPSAGTLEHAPTPPSTEQPLPMPEAQPTPQTTNAPKELAKTTHTSRSKQKQNNKKQKKHKKDSKHTYAQDVYKRRFKQFHHIRLLSLLVGGSIFLIMTVGMWQLYTKVFSTIENTEHLFLITEKRRTNVIQFNTLEDVRSSWNEKYNATTTEFIKPLFPLPPEPVENTEEEE